MSSAAVGNNRAVVLVVEDEDAIRDIASNTLRDAGVEVVEAANAEEALSIISGGADVHLLFTDVRMPGLMNGVELARMAKRLRPSLRTIITSAAPCLDQPIGLLLADVLFLPKPYDLDLLTAVVVAELAVAPPLGRPDDALLQ